MRLKHKITIAKSLILIAVISLFYQLPVNNISAVVNLSATSVNTVTSSSRNLNLIAGGVAVSLKASVSPANVVNKSVIWSSSNEAVATVNSAGLVTPIAAGISVILVRTVDGGHSDYCTVNVTEKDVTGITLSLNQTTLKLKGSLTLKTVIVPIDASNQTITWSSSNEAVAKVSQLGVVTAIAPGTAGIMAKINIQAPSTLGVGGQKKDGGFIAYCLVYVPEEVEGITLNQSSLKFNLGAATVMLSAKIKPDNLSLKDISWTSSNPGIANVDTKGNVTATSVGTTVITATSVFDKTKKATCSVTVTGSTTTTTTATADLKIHVSRIVLSLHQKALVVGTTFTLSQSIMPSNASNKAVIWSSGNEAVATVSQAGVVTPIAAGEALIIVKTVDEGQVDGCLVTVTKNDVTGVTLNPSQTTLKIKSSLTLNPVITPVNASIKTVNWSSGNETVAKVSAEGVVTALSPGTTCILGRTVDGNFLTYCIVYVPEQVDSITLSKNNIKFDLGDAAVTLTAKIMPDNLTVKDITWTSSNYSVANVDSNGRVTQGSGGTAVITATSVFDKTKKATCSVTVVQHATGITIG